MENKKKVAPTNAYDSTVLPQQHVSIVPIKRVKAKSLGNFKLLFRGVYHD